MNAGQILAVTGPATVTGCVVSLSVAACRISSRWAFTVTPKPAPAAEPKAAPVVIEQRPWTSAPSLPPEPPPVRETADGGHGVLLADEAKAAT